MNKFYDISLESNVIIPKNETITLYEKANNKDSLDLVIMEDANVFYVSIDSIKTKNSYKKIILKKGASLNLITTHFSPINEQLDIYLEDVNAQVNLNSVILAKDINHQLTIKVYHESQSTFSNCNSYIIANHANVNLDIQGIIKANKAKSNCKQKSRGIILDNQSKISVKPTLLIDYYDVFASHGVAIGKLDEDSLYYLMSRGLDKKDAETLIINAFLNPIYQEIKDEKLNQEFIDLTNHHLGR